MVKSLFNKLKVLAIGAHPDDLELGCAAVLHLAKEARGLVVGIPRASKELRVARQAEAERAASILGYDLCIKDLIQDRLDLTGLITAVELEIGSYHPDLVITHFEKDRHQDHRDTYAAVVSACRRFTGSLLFFYVPSTDYEFVPNLFIDIDQETWDLKLRAIRAHKSQALKPYMNDRLLDAYGYKWSLLHEGSLSCCEAYKIGRIKVAL